MFQKKNDVNKFAEELKAITSHTSNTWQQDRKDEEIFTDTMQGKLAEDMFIDFIAFIQGDREIAYLPYDSFRQNNYTKHAPIDGLLYKSDNANLNKGVEKILEDINENEHGSISIETRKYLSKNKLYTVEIKSSRIPDKDYEQIDPINFSKSKQQKMLIEALRKRDYFSYPRFTRSEGRKIHDFDQYCDYVRNTNNQFGNLSDENLKTAIISSEIEIMSDIYTRIFFDWNSTNSLIGYLTGYALKTDFFISPQIINMSRKGKSEDALYYIYPISKTNYLSHIFIENRLWY